MKNCASFSIKTLFMVSFLLTFPSTHWGQDLLISNKIFGKVKKCILKTYSVKVAIDEYDIDELKSKESYEYYKDGAIRNKYIYRDDYVMKVNYLQNGKTSLVNWIFEDGYIKSARDSFIYNQAGEIGKKITSFYYEEKWIVTDIYEFQYEKNELISKIFHKYTAEYDGGDIRPFQGSELYPTMTYVNLTNALAGEIITKLENEIEETNSIMYKEYSEAIANKPYESKLNNLEGLSTFTDITFKREYDTFGNWIKTTLFIAKEPMRIYIRELSYFD